VRATRIRGSVVIITEPSQSSDVRAAGVLSQTTRMSSVPEEKQTREELPQLLLYWRLLRAAQQQQQQPCSGRHERHVSSRLACGRAQSCAWVFDREMVANRQTSRVHRSDGRRKGVGIAFALHGEANRLPRASERARVDPV
jgi:hypothetical protein